MTLQRHTLAMLAGRPIPGRNVVDEQVFPMETAQQNIQSRMY